MELTFDSRTILQVLALAARHPYLVLSIFILFSLVVANVVSIREKRRKLYRWGMPVVPSSKSGDYRASLAGANAKYPDQPYMVDFQDPTCIIPAYCIEKLKNLPDAQLSTNGSMYDRFAIRWTNSGWVGKELAFSIKYDLAKEVDGFFSTIQDEISHAGVQSLPFSSEWTAVDPQEALVQIVGPVIGRMMIGAPLNRDKSWLSASIYHAMAVIIYSNWLRQFPSVLRPIIAPFLPQKRAVERTKRAIADAITPILDQQMTALEEVSKGPSVPSETGRLTKWLLKRYKPGLNRLFSPSLVIRDHYSLCFAAIHGPTLLLTHALIDLASYPQYITPLREEVDRELANAPFEQWTRATLDKMQLLDAFCKESARTNPNGLIAWLRKTHQPVTLSTGHVIPADTLIAATNPYFNHAATPWIEDPGKFYPERWVEDRSDAYPNPDFRFGSASIDSLIFGCGRHACPGRPLGTYVVKDVMAYILSKWDVRLKGEWRGRPENIYHDFIIMPPCPPMGNVQLEIKLRSE
ncbi:cytochrome P450 [Thozetella sp. PMI_491]|nr:cytochrome P450 [Thozetella sp. PMI_491]